MDHENKTEQAVRIFKALAIESRVKIIQLLANRSLCVGALSDMTGISQGAVSQHLRILRDAGLVTPERNGLYIHYHIPREVHTQIKAVLRNIFEPENITPCQKGDRKCAKKKSVKNRKT